MTQPYGAFQVGGSKQPLVSPGTNSLLLDADPAVFYALEFFSFIITQYCGARLLSAASAAGASITAAVAQKYPSLPTPDSLQENQYRFPLLAMGRTRTMTEMQTAGWERDIGMFELLYVLPPLNPGQAEQLLPILHSVYSELRNRATAGFDPAYTPTGGTTGQQAWALAGVEAAGIGEFLRPRGNAAEYGHLEGVGNLWFPSLRMFGHFVERDMYVQTGAGKFTGADITLDLRDPDGTTIDPFVQVSTQQAPTITAPLSPATGSHTGGTTVTINGTLFLSGPPQVKFGANYATSATYVSATQITAVTPAMSGAGTVPVTVTNRDGQSVTLANAFTFT